MKRTTARLLLAVLGCALLPLAPTQAAERSFTEGSVWDISFIRVKPGHEEDYLENLANGWRKIQDEMIKEGVVVSYKIISAPAANPGDWDLMLLIEYKNFAALDTPFEKWDAVARKIEGDEAGKTKGVEMRASVREIFGNKVGRELRFK